MRATDGSMSAFLRLQSEQAATTFSHVVTPPLERGTTWSKVRSSRWPQYWQVKRGRRNTLNRVKAGKRGGVAELLSDPTEGRLISKLGLRPRVSYSDRMLTRSRNTALTATCQHQIDSG